MVSKIGLRGLSEEEKSNYSEIDTPDNFSPCLSGEGYSGAHGGPHSRFEKYNDVQNLWE